MVTTHEKDGDGTSAHISINFEKLKYLNFELLQLLLLPEAEK